MDQTEEQGGQKNLGSEISILNCDLCLQSKAEDRLAVEKERQEEIRKEQDDIQQEIFMRQQELL